MISVNLQTHFHVFTNQIFICMESDWRNKDKWQWKKLYTTVHVRMKPVTMMAEAISVKIYCLCCYVFFTGI